MKMIVEDSLDGKAWRVLHVVGVPQTFNNKNEAKAWFTSLEEANNLDWKVGFLHRYRDGRFYRLVYKNGKEVKWA